MKLDAEQIRGIVALREKLKERLSQLREEMEATALNIDALDAALKQSSFTRASQFTPEPAAERPDAAPSSAVEPGRPDAVPPGEAVEPAGAPDAESGAVPIMKGDDTIGFIRTDPDKITITVEAQVRADTPPFPTFFVSRIIGGMAAKDTAEVEAGRLAAGDAIRHDIKTEDDALRQVTIYNYRLEERAREIASTIKWALSRMLENAR